MILIFFFCDVIFCRFFLGVLRMRLSSIRNNLYCLYRVILQILKRLLFYFLYFILVLFLLLTFQDSVHVNHFVIINFLVWLIFCIKILLGFLIWTISSNFFLFWFILNDIIILNLIFICFSMFDLFCFKWDTFG